MIPVRKSVVTKMLGLFHRAGAGHIGSALSCTELLIHLFFQRLTPEDRFLLSKGHAAAALYAVLAERGLISEDLLDTYYRNGTLLAAHPPCQTTLEIPQIPFGTGSLGHGLSLGAGLAMAHRFKNGAARQVFCLLSDGECNEGSTWEAALFASHHGLRNLTAVIDCNGIQGFGRTSEVLDTSPLDEKWRAFGFDTFVIENGNDAAQIEHAFALAADSPRDAPKCLIAKTVKGHGVSFMENTIDWHYLPMNEDQYSQALRETVGRAKE